MVARGLPEPLFFVTSARSALSLYGSSPKRMRTIVGERIS